jgi:hypothetical protein
VSAGNAWEARLSEGESAGLADRRRTVAHANEREAEIAASIERARAMLPGPRRDDEIAYQTRRLDMQRAWGRPFRALLDNVTAYYAHKYRPAA